MTALALLFTLAAIGISETRYLIQKRTDHSNPVCVIGGQCQLVLKSKYSTMFGMHNDVLGLFFYCTVAVLAGTLLVGKFPMEVLQAIESVIEIMIGIGAIISLVFINLQWKVIKAWCFWCLMSAATIACMGVIILTSDLLFGNV